MQNRLREQIYQILTNFEPVTTKEIQELLEKHKVSVERETINSMLYGTLRDVVIRDVNEQGVPSWRIRRKTFSAAGGLEAKLYKELINRKVITKENSQLGFGVKNTKNNKRYYLDIAIRIRGQRYNIEVDGFDHIRADALASMEGQIVEKGNNCEIDIDWMDNKKSYIEFNEIDTAKVYKWCGNNIDWCIRYHEELLWPKDITRNIWLIDKGWKIIRFWNPQVRNDVQGCVDEITGWIDT